MEKNNNKTRKRSLGMTKKVIGAAFFILHSSLFVSCSDFLDILPMNDVVLENYWTEKADVTSVMNSCYEALENGDAMNRMAVWGELRSDNLRAGANVPNSINEILKENLLPSNEYCNWSKIYECINRCNIVCHYAPKVQQIDPNYTYDEMMANVAEATTLRLLLPDTHIPRRTVLEGAKHRRHPALHSAGYAFRAGAGHAHQRPGKRQG